MRDRKLKFWLIVFWFFGIPAVLHGTNGQSIIIGHFSKYSPGVNLSGWTPLTFPNIETLTRYELVKETGRTVLWATSRSSASGLVKKIDVDPMDYPMLSWDWKISNTISKGDVTKKSGDDYAARVYVTFDDDGTHTNWFQKARMAMVKMLYDQVPPFATIAYVWANRADVESFHPNAYTDRCQMVAVESGPENQGQWRKVRRDVVEDFRRAFGHDPFRISGIAVMTDTDNTGESASAWYGDISLHRK